MPRPYYLLSLATLGSCLLLSSPPAIAQDPGAVLLLFEEQSAVLGDRLRDVLDRDLETERELLDAISDLRATAEAMEAEKGLILNAFRRKPPTEILALIDLVWKLGYQAGTAEMLADEWERLLDSPLMRVAPAQESCQ